MVLAAGMSSQGADATLKGRVLLGAHGGLSQYDLARTLTSTHPIESMIELSLIHI